MLPRWGGPRGRAARRSRAGWSGSATLSPGRFGPLEGMGAMRLAIASVTAMLLGLQLAFGAFFLALLGMMRAGPARR